MKIIIFPGASKSNKEWADLWGTELEKNGYEVYRFYYEHWKDQEAMFSFEKEALKIVALGNEWKNCIVISKSIGTLLTVYCVSKKIIEPSKAIFLGFPSKMDGEKDASISIDLKSWLKNYLVETTVFQNEKDPVTNFSDVYDFLHQHKTFSLQSTPGDTHKYSTEIHLKKILPLLK